MKRAAEDVENRLPVWRAFSELFIDTELSDRDYLHIAKVCIGSPYSMKDLEEILFRETWSAFSLNLYSMAGNWTGWGDDFIQSQVLKKCRFKLYIHWRLNPLKRFFLADSWGKVTCEINVLRL